MEFLPRSFRSKCARIDLSDLIAICLAILFLDIYSETTHADQPNIVMIVSDDVGYNELGFTQCAQQRQHGLSDAELGCVGPAKRRRFAILFDRFDLRRRGPDS